MFGIRYAKGSYPSRPSFCPSFCLSFCPFSELLLHYWKNTVHFKCRCVRRLDFMLICKNSCLNYWDVLKGWALCSHATSKSKSCSIFRTRLFYNNSTFRSIFSRFAMVLLHFILTMCKGGKVKRYVRSLTTTFGGQSP